MTPLRTGTTYVYVTFTLPRADRFLPGCNVHCLGTRGLSLWSPLGRRQCESTHEPAASLEGGRFRKRCFWDVARAYRGGQAGSHLTYAKVTGGGLRFWWCAREAIPTLNGSSQRN